jgi:hypothetical protein
VSRSEVTQTWLSLNRKLFLQLEFAAYKEDHFDSENSRKVRDKYQAILESVQNNIDSGNQSHKEGDISELFKYAEQIQKDLSAIAEKKDDDKLYKKEQIVIGAEVLSKNGISNVPKALKKKHLDGTITDISDTRKIKPSLEDTLFGLLQMPSDEKSNENQKGESENKLLQWINSRNITTNKLVNEAILTEDDFNMLNNFNTF